MQALLFRRFLPGEKTGLPYHSREGGMGLRLRSELWPAFDFDSLLTVAPRQAPDFGQSLLPMHDRGVTNTVLSGLRKLTRDDNGLDEYS